VMLVIKDFDRTRKDVCVPIIDDHLHYLRESITEHCEVLGISEDELPDVYVAPDNPLSYEEQLERLLDNKANAIKVRERLDANGTE